MASKFWNLGIFFLIFCLIFAVFGQNPPDPNKSPSQKTGAGGGQPGQNQPGSNFQAAPAAQGAGFGHPGGGPGPQDPHVQPAAPQAPGNQQPFFNNEAKRRLQPNEGGLLADSYACAEEIAKFCTKVPRNSDIAMLQCLQDAGDEILSDGCQTELWNLKLNLTQDDRFRQAAFQYCGAEMKTYPCQPVGAVEQAHLLLCLIEFKNNMTNGACTNFLTRMEAIVFTDFNLVGRFVKKCQSDIERYECGKGHYAPDVKAQIKQQARVIHSQGGTLECLLKKIIEANRNTNDLNPECRHEVLRLAEMQADDFNLDRPLYFACRDDRERFCHDVQAGNGQVFQCLLGSLGHRQISYECRNTLVMRVRLMNRDYKVSHALVTNCQQAITENQCHPQGLEEQADHFFLTYILLCLENAAKNNRVIPQNCQNQMFEHRRLLMSEAKMDPELVLSCATDIELHCRQLQGGGETLHCLMNVASRPQNSSYLQLQPACNQAISKFLQTVDIGSNYEVDEVLYKDCKAIIEGVCKKEAATETDVLSCLMNNVESPQMSDACESRLLEVQYFLARDFNLDPQLYKACQEDAAQKCSYKNNWLETQNKGKSSPQQGPDPGYMVLTCLYRHAYEEDPKLQLKETCAVEVRRVLHERAVSVHLLPQIEDACRKDLGQFCSQSTKPGEEWVCLQEKMKELSDKCRDEVKKFTLMQSKDSRLDRVLGRACKPVLDEYCKEFVGKRFDEGDVDECLLRHKAVPEMTNKCRAYINHVELMQLKDYEFSFKFRQSCKKDIEKNCLADGNTDKVSIVRCLSEIIVHHSLLNEGPEVSKECRKQMKAEYFKMDTLSLASWKKADKQLMDFCAADLSKHGCDREETMEKAIECLKDFKPDLETACKKYLFKRERLEFGDNTFDLTLTRTCNREIRQFCPNEEKSHVLHCLKSFKNDPDMSVECLQLVEKRQREQAGDIRLQPVLYQQCLPDIKEYCKADYQALRDQMKAHKEEELQARIITCLREAWLNQKHLRPTCEVELKGVIYESEIDPQLDPPFYKYCKEDLKNLCGPNILASEGHVSLMECMKAKFKGHFIKNNDCRKELERKMKEMLFDIQLDEGLYEVCSLDLKHYCYDIQPRDGKQLKCLLMAAQSSNVKMSDKCKDKLLDRQALWKLMNVDSDFKVPNGLGDFATLIGSSPSRNYLLTVLMVIVLVIFGFGLCFGRVTKRIRREMKNR